ncbi:hypothetical protein C6502_09685 [Candidatus Poribacteria bacterium]|nr:MAG: hypothetical protein C6502_09685 [Candidatus Poribacteria bacterium]
MFFTFHASRFTPKNMRLYLSLLLIILSLLTAGELAARTNLSIISPTTDFTTNNQTVEIRGIVESSIGREVIVSTNTPGGIPDLAQLTHSIYGVVVDLGNAQELKGMLIRHVVDQGFPRGPRLAHLAFSKAGNSFSTGQPFNIPSGIDPNFHSTVVDFPSVISAQFIQIEMLEGWQIEPIAIESIQFLDTNDRVIQGQIQSIAIRLPLTDACQPSLTGPYCATFSIDVMLEAGVNRLSVTARELAASDPDSLNAVDRETISLFYLPELEPEAAEGGVFTLSDGDRATVVIPVDAFDEQITKLHFFSVPPEAVDPFSYRANSRIVKGTAPVVVYRFEALRQGVFPAEATSALHNQPPTFAVDGILEPPSTWVAGLVPLPVSLTIDLKVQRTVSRIVVHANVEGENSFGPKRAILFTSNDNENFIDVLEVTAFDDRVTTIELPTRPSARYFRLEITESKQVNNLQLNEVEFFDVSGAKIVSFDPLEYLILGRPALLELAYRASDLMVANIRRESDLKIFAWDASAQEWQLVGGEIDLHRRVVHMELNFISQVALFQAVPSQIQVAWSFNPFSPDGNGIADRTRLTIVNHNTSHIGGTEPVVEIFDLHNKLIRTLVNQTVMSSNTMSVEWDGRDEAGEIVNIGPYIYQIRLKSDDQVEVRNGVIVVGK